MEERFARAVEGLDTGGTDTSAKGSILELEKLA